ncbi:MAG: hypothetical protein HY902_18035 [Deltaproteobacteria bacterium]|nr:hypothetical protein [Deltaproteobacteria bacterium]
MNRWSSILAFVACLASSLAAPALAAPKADSPKVVRAKAEALNAEAKEAFKSGQFDRAAELFMQVYDLSKQPAAVYNAARAREQGGKLVEAKALFELFLRLERTAKGQEDAKKRIADIDAKLKQDAEDKAKAEAEAKAKAEAEQKARQEEADRRLREAEQKTRDAEQKAREAQILAEKEQAAKAEAEARARAEAEARGRIEAEKKAKEAELRAKDAEARAKEAEARARQVPVGPAPTPRASNPPAADKTPPVATAPQPKPQPDPLPPEPTSKSLLGGVVLAALGGASLQQAAPDARAKPDLSFGVGAWGWMSWGAKGAAPWWAAVCEAGWEGYSGFSVSGTAATPTGLVAGGGIALPRLAGLMVTVKRHQVQLANGKPDFGYTTLGVRVVVAPKTTVVALGFEGLVASDRSDVDLKATDEFGYGPVGRLTLEFGFNIANAPLSK